MDDIPRGASQIVDRCDALSLALIAACHVGVMRARLVEAELVSVSTALKGGLISAEEGVAWLRGAGLMEYFVTPVPGCVSMGGDTCNEGSNQGPETGRS